MGGEELGALAAAEAAIEEAGWRLAFRPGTAIKHTVTPAVFEAEWSLACRVCAASGRLCCPLHSPFRPPLELPPFRAIGGS